MVTHQPGGAPAPAAAPHHGDGATCPHAPRSILRTARTGLFFPSPGEAGRQQGANQDDCATGVPLPQPTKGTVFFNALLKDVYLWRIALLTYTETVTHVCMPMCATGHADHRRAADLGEL